MRSGRGRGPRVALARPAVPIVLSCPSRHAAGHSCVRGVMWVCWHPCFQEPNLIPYQLFMNSSKNSAAYLLRQYFVNNLADRLNTYPTPTDIEKRWICYQILCALEQAHAKVRGAVLVGGMCVHRRIAVRLMCL